MKAESEQLQCALSLIIVHVVVESSRLFVGEYTSAALECWAAAFGHCFISFLGLLFC